MKPLMSLITEFRKLITRYGIEWLQRYYADYRGYVESNEDPKFLGRLKLRVPQIYGDEVPEYWAASKGMFAGAKVGFFAIPNAGDGVWVSFENGDARYPLWQYGWFTNNSEIPQLAKVDGNKPRNMVWGSTEGHRIELDDFNQTIKITDKAGSIILFDDTGIKMVAASVKIGAKNIPLQPAILGDKLTDFFTTLFTDLGTITVPISGTATSTFNTSTQWLPLVQKWTLELSNLKSGNISVN